MSDYNFEKIPLWSSENPNFEVTVDDASGRIPVARLERWQDFAEFLESDFMNREKTQLIFRGHRRFDWGLMPTLGRVTESGIVDEAPGRSWSVGQSGGIVHLFALRFDD